MKNGQFMEYATVKQIAAPKDINASAITGARASLKEGERVTAVISMGAGAGTTDAISFQQHDAATAGNSKAITISRYYLRLDAETSFTKVELGTAVSTLDLSASIGGVTADVVVEFEAQDLDVNNDYAYVSVNVAASAAAKVVSGLYVYGEPKRCPAYELAF